MDKLTKSHYLAGGFAALIFCHLILIQSWTPGGGDGYWAIFVMAGFITTCESYNPGCVETRMLIDGSVQCAAVLAPFALLAVYSFFKAFKTSQ